MLFLAQAIRLVFAVLQIAIILDVLFSWVRPDPYNPLVRLVSQVAGVIVNPLRRVVPPFSGLDITPMIALILLQIAESLIMSLIAW